MWITFEHAETIRLGISGLAARIGPETAAQQRKTVMEQNCTTGEPTRRPTFGFLLNWDAKNANCKLDFRPIIPGPTWRSRSRSTQ